MLATNKVVFFLFIVALGAISFVSSSTINYSPREPLPCIDKRFSIVAHIVRDSSGAPGITEATILSRIAYLNKEFEPICASFEVCEFRYIDNFQYNFIEQGQEWPELQIKYHQKNRINMFFVVTTNVSGSVSSFSTIAGIDNLDAGGIVMVKQATPKAYVHEMGHYFGLYNTFSAIGGLELVDGSNCATAGDQICDTPADPFIVGTINQDYIDPVNPCRFIYAPQDANGDYYNPNVGNFMSNYPDFCKCEFTYEQFQKMANTYLVSNPKMW